MTDLNQAAERLRGLNRYYLASMFNEDLREFQVVRVTSEGANRSENSAIQSEYADRWALVIAKNMNEARIKFSNGEVAQWHS